MALNMENETWYTCEIPRYVGGGVLLEAAGTTVHETVAKKQGIDLMMQGKFSELSIPRS
jgi:hypothetical protein